MNHKRNYMHIYLHVCARVCVYSKYRKNNKQPEELKSTKISTMSNSVKRKGNIGLESREYFVA